jgi:P-type Cu2+ transporter
MLWGRFHLGFEKPSIPAPNNKHELTKYKPGMMTLVAFSITIAYIYSSLTILGLGKETFFLELVTLINIMLLGRWLEIRSFRKTSQALERLALLLPVVAHKKYPDGSIRDVETDKLAIDDIVIIRPEERISTDGIIIEGESKIKKRLKKR